MNHDDSREGLDVIGDVHGHFDSLVSLLVKLGYCENSSGIYLHPAGRKALFVGDFLNRGPKIRETLQLIRPMVQAQAAFAVLGNHEFNVLGMETPGVDGSPLRPHTAGNLDRVAETMAAFRDIPNEWNDNVQWMRSLPLSIERAGMRASHAAWHPPSLKLIDGRTFENNSFLQAAFNRKSPEAKAVNVTLKGITVPLPKNKIYRDRFGIPRKKGRIRWWMDPTLMSYAELIFPPMENAPGKTGPPTFSTECVVPYPASECPHFFGHYCLPPTESKIHGNVVCVDGCVTCDGKLWAYRFDGESAPEKGKLIHSG
jgi:hypothetical protein